MVTVRTLATRDRDGTEYGTFYLTEELADSDERKLDSMKDLLELKKLFAKVSQNNFNHEYFLDNFKRELAFFAKNVDKVLKSLEKSKRYVEINESRYFDEMKSLILELSNLAQKNSDPSVHEIVTSTIKDIETIMNEEKQILKEISTDQKLLAQQRTPKKALKLKLTDSDLKITELMKEQGHDFKRFKEISDYYLKIKRIIIHIIRFGNNPDAEKDSLIEELKENLKLVIEGYKNSLRNEFRIDTKLSYSEFRNLGYLKEMFDFLTSVMKFYAKLPKDKKSEIKTFSLFMDYFIEKQSDMRKLLTEVGYWAQQDFNDGKLLIDKDTKIVRKLHESLSVMRTPNRKDFKLNVEKLDSDVPCYYITFFEDVKNQETGEYEHLMTAKVLIGSCPDLLKKLKKKFPTRTLDEIVPTQIYMPSLEVNIFSDNTLVMFPYIVHNYMAPVTSGKKIDIIGSSEDLDRLRDSMYYSIYRDFNFKHNENKFKNINDEINFVKADKEYSFKNETQTEIDTSSIGRSSLKILQQGRYVFLYVDSTLIKKLLVDPKPTPEKLFKKMSLVKKNGHWINRGHKLKCFILGAGSGFTLGEYSSSKIMHFANTNIWIDPTGNPMQTLIKENIHPDVIDAVMLTHLHEDHYAGFGSFLKYKKTRGSEFTLITTRELFDQILFKFSYMFDNGDEQALKKFLKPIFIPINKPVKIEEFVEKDMAGRVTRKFDSGLEIAARKNFNGLASYGFKFSYLDRVIAFSGSHTIKKFDFYSAFDSVLSNIGLDVYSYQKLYDYEAEKAMGLWSVAASLRQRSLLDDTKMFYTDFSSVAVQNLVELKVPMDKIALLNNSPNIIANYFKTLRNWYSSENFSWYDDADIIVHSMGPAPKMTSPDMILELNRYLRSNSDKKYKLFVEHCPSIEYCFPTKLKTSRIIDMARKEFAINGIGLLPEFKDRQLQP
jgi:hypothetical protein